MEPGRPGHGSPGAGSTFWVGSGQVTGQCPIHMTWSFNPDSAIKNVLSVYRCAVTVSVFGSSGTGRLSTVSIHVLRSCLMSYCKASAMLYTAYTCSKPSKYCPLRL